MNYKEIKGKTKLGHPRGARPVRGGFCVWMRRLFRMCRTFGGLGEFHVLVVLAWFIRKEDTAELWRCGFGCLGCGHCRTLNGGPHIG